MFSALVSLRHRARLVVLGAAICVAVPVGLTSTSANAVPASVVRTSVTASTSAPVKAATTKPAKKLQPKALAKKLMAAKKYNWKSKRQYNCLKALWNRESGWRVHAGRAGGAYGIPQAMPGKKMGSGWRHSAKAQIKWGLKYIDGRYGSPCSADNHQRTRGWY